MSVGIYIYIYTYMAVGNARGFVFVGVYNESLFFVLYISAL